MYKPLPKELRLGFSDIHDIGLFAKKDIEKGHNFGMSHLELGQLLLRTPLGGFLNHADDANCTKVRLLLTRQQWNHNVNLPDERYNLDFKKWNLLTLKDIKEGEELTVKYTFYKIYDEKN
jgi:SET domain-containing protein